MIRFDVTVNGKSVGSIEVLRTKTNPNGIANDYNCCVLNSNKSLIYYTVLSHHVEDGYGTLLLRVLDDKGVVDAIKKDYDRRRITPKGK